MALNKNIYKIRGAPYRRLFWAFFLVGEEGKKKKTMKVNTEKRREEKTSQIEDTQKIEENFAWPLCTILGH